MIERRLHPRRLVNSRVMVFHETFGHMNGRTVDVSDGGLFVEIEDEANLRVGDNVKVHLMDSSNPKIAFNMKVIRCEDGGCGLMFLDYEVNGERRSMEHLRRQWSRRKHHNSSG